MKRYEINLELVETAPGITFGDCDPLWVHNKHVVLFPRARVLAVPFPQEAAFLALTSEMERAFSLAQVQEVPEATRKTVSSRFQSPTAPPPPRPPPPAMTSPCSPSAEEQRGLSQPGREGGLLPWVPGSPGCLCPGPQLGKSGCPPSSRIPQAPN